MTSDEAEEVRQSAPRHRFETCLVAMSITNHAAMEGVVIGIEPSSAKSISTAVEGK